MNRVSDKISWQAGRFLRRSHPLVPQRLLRVIALAMSLVLLASCSPVDLNAKIPVFDTGADTSKWAAIPAGKFLWGQHDEEVLVDHDYEMMVYLVTTKQYTLFLNTALTDGTVKVDGDQIVSYYPGDKFNGGRHEQRIDAGDWVLIPLKDGALRLTFDGQFFAVKDGYENHPMSVVSWFGAWAYCRYYGWRLPSEMEWEKAARGSDGRPFPWGNHIARNNANYYASRDPFEDMRSFGSRTSPVGFYNGQTYGDYATLDSASPYGLYDMAGNEWEWMGDIYEQQHYRYLRGGSKDTYDMDLRVWVRNSASPIYVSPGAGFRCARDVKYVKSENGDR